MQSLFVPPPAAPAAPADVSVVEFSQLRDFKDTAMPLLERDVLRNTLALTQLESIAQSSSSDINTTDDDNTRLSVVSCAACSASVAVVAGRNKGLNYNACYVSAGACDHISAQLGRFLQVQQLCDKLTLPAAAAEALRAAQQPAAARWPVDLTLKLMVHKDNSAPTAAAAAAAAAVAQQQCDDPASVVPAAAPPAAAAATTTHAPAPAAPASAAHSTAPASEQQAPAAASKLQLRQCGTTTAAAADAGAGSDAALVVAWTAAFLKDGFDLDDMPPREQVEGSVLPRLQQGLYYTLRDTNNATSADSSSASSSTPLCLVGHTPSSARSTRITLVFTPVEHRGNGYAKVAVRELVRLLSGQLGFTSICLVADKEEPHVVSLYEALGFVVIDELHTLRRPDKVNASATATEGPEAASREDNS